MIIVTGGAGFIGSNIVAALDKENTDEIVVCDRLREGRKWRNIAKRSLESIISPDNILAFIEAQRDRVNWIFHMGAISATTATDGDQIIRTNFDFSKTLWQAATRHRIPYFYASSAAVYGDGALGFEDWNEVSLLRQLRPLNLYGWSKWLFDLWVLRSVARGDAVPPLWAGLRFFNVFGPNEYHKGSMQSLVSKIIATHRNGGKLQLFNSYREGIDHGEQRRDFICVDDVVSVLLWLRECGETPGILNLGTGIARTFRDLASAAIRAAGDDPFIEYIDMPESIRSAYQYYTCADITRLRHLGYDRKFTELEIAVGNYVRDYLLKDDPYR